MKQNLRQLWSQLPYLPQALKLVWQASRRWTAAWAILLIIQGLLPVATVYLTRTLVDGLVGVWGQGGGWESLRPLFWPAGLMGAVLLLSEILSGLFSWIRTAQSELVQDHIHHLIHEQAVTLDLSFYETPDYYDSLHRARVDALNRPVALLENLGGLVQNGITLAAMAAVLLPFGYFLPLVLLLSTLPAMFVVLRHAALFHQWRVRNTGRVRRARYYDWILTQREAAAEIRLFGLGDHFRSAFAGLRQELRDEQVRLSRNEALSQLSAGGVGLLTLVTALGWVAWQAAQGVFSLGEVALFYQAFSQGQRLMRTLLATVGEIYRNIMFLENLFGFLALKPRLKQPQRPLPAPQLAHSIELEKVTFRYPGSERVALHDFDLTIPAGQVVAIVGENGAGKSTLIKLLCRFYDPEAGRVLFDGVDLSQIDQAELWRQITVLFQEPMHFHTSVGRNIALGDLTAAPTQAEIERAAQAAGADTPIAKLPEKYETVLGKWFGGGELSVGEWQRVALARAFLRRAALVILDEPTSAMDSWAEADWMGRFRSLVTGRTALIITHRFTTAMKADIIHLMADGRIVESGSHAELIAQNGRYAQSWRQQYQAELERSAPLVFPAPELERYDR